MTQYVISTTESQVWFVEAENPDDAEAQIIDQHEHEPEAVFYEGTLDEYLTELDRDGISLLNP